MLRVTPPRRRPPPAARCPPPAAHPQVIDVGYGGGRGKAPEKLERRLSFSRRKAGSELRHELDSRQELAAEKREAALAAKVERARLRASGGGSARNSAADVTSDAAAAAVVADGAREERP